MKNKKLIFFFFFFSSFILISFSSNVNAFDSPTLTIKADWLSVQPGKFEDASPYPWENKIAVDVGGGDLLEFNNLGIIASSDTEVIFGSEVTFGFEATINTYAGFRDIYPYINLNQLHTENFFRIQHMYIDSGAESSWYQVSWNTINLGTMWKHDYHGKLPITVSIKEITPSLGTIVLNGQNFSVPEYIPDILQVEVTKVKSGNVGEYEDIFTNAAEVEKGTVTLRELDDNFGSSIQKLVDYYNSKELGWEAGDIVRGQTLQQFVVGGSQKGATFHNPSPANDKSFRFKVNAQLTPEVYEYCQYNRIRYAEIKYWHWGWYDWSGNNIDPLEGPKWINAPKRITAIHTRNPFIHWDFIVKTRFYATIPSTAELTQAILNDPYLKRGDMVWDTSFTGDYEVEIPLTNPDIWDILDGLFGGLFGGIGSLIVLIVIIGVVGGVIYIILKSRSRRTVIQIVKS
ncbi:MAG: hypothetical protein ACFFDF_24230 [Candidatus Odinarchaeota archaeon]